MTKTRTDTARTLLNAGWTYDEIAGVLSPTAVVLGAGGDGGPRSGGGGRMYGEPPTGFEAVRSDGGKKEPRVPPLRSVARCEPPPAEEGEAGSPRLLDMRLKTLMGDLERYARLACGGQRKIQSGKAVSAHLLRALAAEGRLSITHEIGNSVIAHWPTDEGEG